MKNKLIKISIIASLTLLVMSCEVLDVDLINPCDPTVDPGEWAPRHLSMIIIDGTKIKLSWDKSPYNNIEGYMISRRVGINNWEKDIAVVNANVLEWTDSSINLTQFFEYKVRAYFQNYNSGYSNESVYYCNMEKFVLVQGGTFQMGSTSGGYSEKPVHSVTLSSFYIGRYEVTQGEWQAVMGTNSTSGFGMGINNPVYYVNWYAVLVYCNKLSIQEGLTPCYAKGGYTNPDNWGTVPTSTNANWNAITCNRSVNGYRLPTEAEWEYAARGGNRSQGYTYAGSNIVGNVAWYYDNSSAMTHPVGTKAPNELGIYDMSGNVWEWCWDRYGSYTTSAQTNPTGATSGSGRVIRSGGWSDGDHGCRVAYRGNNDPDERLNFIGFRLSRTIIQNREKNAF